VRVDGSPLQLTLLDAVADERQIALRRSSRARRLSVRVHRDARVEVVAPLRTSARVIADFVARHSQWIERRRAEAQLRRPPVETFPPARIELRAFSETWRVHVAGGAGRLAVRERGPGLLEVAGRANGADGLRRALLRWLMRHCEEPLARELRDAAQRHGFTYTAMSLRRQRTRWGSCSVRGTISLNVCLAFQRPEVLRYLLVHELAHRLHMDHSRAFWACVARHCPDWAVFDRELLDGWRHVPAWIFRGANHD
jgi:hypothetical protein